jgi:N-acetylneuraminic acid mutarotase
VNYWNILEYATIASMLDMVATSSSLPADEVPGMADCVPVSNPCSTPSRLGYVAALAFALALFASTVPATAETFTQAAPLSQARTWFSLTLLADGQALAVGGTGNEQGGLLRFLTSAERYDPATNTWTEAGAMSVGRTLHATVLLPSQQVLVVGGSTDNWVSIASAEKYDPLADEWTFAGTLATARTQPKAVVLDSGKVLVVGGLNDMGTVGSAELYDPATSEWSSAGAMSRTRYVHSATLLPSGKVLVVGGIEEPSYETLASAELYDPDLNIWLPAASLAQARSSHTATLLPSGIVLVAGGFDSAFGGSPLASAELYDETENTWTDAGSLNEQRVAHTATLLPSGQVLVTGGAWGSSALVSAELYDPQSDAWTETDAMSTARSSHAAVLLGTGEVLVAGGIGEAQLALGSAELYGPDQPDAIFSDGFETLP